MIQKTTYALLHQGVWAGSTRRNRSLLSTHAHRYGTRLILAWSYPPVVAGPPCGSPQGRLREPKFSEAGQTGGGR